MMWFKRTVHGLCFKPRWSLLQRTKRRRKGQSLVLVALLMFALIGMAAVVMDGGIAYATRRKAQNAADAGSLAGARQLALGLTDSQIYSAVTEYTNTRNGAGSFVATYYPDGQPVGAGTVPGSAYGVLVTARITTTTFFATVLGRSQTPVNATAAASFGSVMAMPPGASVQPLARKCDEPSMEQCGFVYGQSYEIWQGGGSGNLGWLSWNGSNASQYVTQMLTPGNPIDYVDPHGDPACSNNRLAVGCWVQGLPGVDNSSANRDRLNQWIALGGGAAGTPMLIAVWDTSESGGSGTNYKIKGFAAFIVESYNLPSGSMRGRFMNWTVTAEIQEGTGGYGLWSLHLRRP